MTTLVLAVLSTTGLLAPVSPAPAADLAPSDPPAEAILVLDFEVHDQGVNARDDAEIDSLAAVATRLFREEVERRGAFELVREAAHEGTSAEGDGARASECRTRECLREAARRAGATHVVRGRYVKLSNLIRYLAVELVDVSDGRVVRRASAELKGQRDAILTRAVEILHERPGDASGARADAAAGAGG
jgi:hypothetical protein